MKDYSRKQYSDLNYRDLMGNKTAKSIWNDVLERFPEQAEFAKRNSSTPLSRSISAFIRQSEFKKPYKNVDFVNMEGLWEGPGKGTQYRPGTFDNPYNMQNPIALPIDDGPFSATFDAESAFEWCPGLSARGTIHGTHPITGLTVTFAHEGYEFEVISGLNTNEVVFNLTADVDQGGFITIEASMISSDGLLGDSNVNLFEYGSCCTTAPGAPLGGSAYRNGELYSLQRPLLTTPYDATWSAARDASSSKILVEDSPKICSIHRRVDPIAPFDPDKWACGRLVVGLSYPAFPDVVSGVWVTTEMRYNLGGISPYGCSLWSMPDGFPYGTAVDESAYSESSVMVSDNICHGEDSPFGQYVNWKFNDYGVDLINTLPSKHIWLMIREHHYDVGNVEIAPFWSTGYELHISEQYWGPKIGIGHYCPEDYPTFVGWNGEP